MTDWSDSGIGHASFVALFVGCVLAQGILVWRALRRRPRSVPLSPDVLHHGVPLETYVWFGLAGVQLAFMRAGWLPDASPVLPLVGVVMGLGALVRCTLEAPTSRSRDSRAA